LVDRVTQPVIYKTRNLTAALSKAWKEYDKNVRVFDSHAVAAPWFKWPEEVASGKEIIIRRALPCDCLIYARLPYGQSFFERTSAFARKAVILPVPVSWNAHERAVDDSAPPVDLVRELAVLIEYGMADPRIPHIAMALDSSPALASIVQAEDARRCTWLSHRYMRGAFESLREAGWISGTRTVTLVANSEHARHSSAAALKDAPEWMGHKIVVLQPRYVGGQLGRLSRDGAAPGDVLYFTHRTAGVEAPRWLAVEGRIRWAREDFQEMVATLERAPWYLRGKEAREPLLAPEFLESGAPFLDTDDPGLLGPALPTPRSAPPSPLKARRPRRV
jgi:hypothetical protein